MKKKLTALLATLVLVFSCVAFAACGDKKDSTGKESSTEQPEIGEPENDTTVDTFVGVVSETSYASVQAAAEAFLAKEVAGMDETLQAVYVGQTSKGELSDSEKAALTISDTEKNLLQKAEKVEVRYERNRVNVDTLRRVRASVSNANAETATQTDETVTQTMYALTYDDDTVKYYTPLPEEGEYLTKSYYDSVFDYSKYINASYKVSYAEMNEDAYAGTNKDNYVAETNNYDFNQGIVVKMGTLVDGTRAGMSASYIPQTHFDTQTPQYMEGGDIEMEEYYIEKNNAVVGMRKMYGDPAGYEEIEFLPNATFDSQNTWIWKETGLGLLFAYADAAEFVKTETGFGYIYYNKEEDSGENTSDGNIIGYWRSMDETAVTVKLSVVNGCVNDFRLYRFENSFREKKGVGQNDEYEKVENNKCNSMLQGAFSEFGSTIITVPADIWELLKNLQ